VAKVIEVLSNFVIENSKKFKIKFLKEIRAWLLLVILKNA
jgi:hypothetical protein